MRGGALREGVGLRQGLGLGIKEPGREDKGLERVLISGARK